jgi:hypothetical protein
MKAPTHFLAALGLAFVATAATASADDLTITAKVTRDNGPATTTTSYVSGDHIRFGTGEADVIADLKSGDMTMIDNKKRQYFVITRKDLDQMQARMKDAMNSPEMKRAQEQMKNLPPDVQKKMQAAMGGLSASVTVQKMGSTRKIAGYNCESWTVSYGTMVKNEECLTTELPLPAQVWTSYQDFAARMRGMSAAMGPMSKGIGEIQEKTKEMKGFPLARTTSSSFMGRASTSTFEVTEVKKGAVPASAWQVPAGYAKIDSPMAKMGAPGK